LVNWQGVVSTQLDQESYKRLDSYCSRNNLYKAAVVREAILDHLGRKLKEEELEGLKDLKLIFEKLSSISPQDHPQVQELLQETQKVITSLSGTTEAEASRTAMASEPEGEGL
jgi:predicted DNA-binding protein